MCVAIFVAQEHRVKLSDYRLYYRYRIGSIKNLLRNSEASYMKLLVVRNTEFIDKPFDEPLLGAVEKVADFDASNYRELSPEMAAEYGGVVLGGVPLGYGFDTIDERANRLGWLQQVDVAVLGICLGHQTIGRSFGSSIKYDVEAEKGLCLLQKIGDDELFKNVPPDFEALLKHRGSITLPEGFRLLASSEVCQNEAMKHAEKPIYGLQFHPEVSPARTREPIFANFARIAMRHQVSRAQ
jgi:GMP synthase (glutamine-hydrolysing)